MTLELKVFAASPENPSLVPNFHASDSKSHVKKKKKPKNSKEFDALLWPLLLLALVDTYTQRNTHLYSKKNKNKSSENI